MHNYELFIFAGDTASRNRLYRLRIAFEFIRRNRVSFREHAANENKWSESTERIPRGNWREPLFLVSCFDKPISRERTDSGKLLFGDRADRSYILAISSPHYRI